MQTPLDPRAFLDLATSLTDAIAADEATLRTAVGRAYYSVFLQARDILGIGGRRNIHQRVIIALKRQDPAAGTQLEKLASLRGMADYEMIVADPLLRDWQVNWRQARSFAEHIAGRLSRLERWTLT